MRDQILEFEQYLSNFGPESPEETTTIALQRLLLTEGIERLLQELSALSSGLLESIGSERAFNLVRRFASRQSICELNVVVAADGFLRHTSSGVGQMLSVFLQHIGSTWPDGSHGEVKI